MKKIYSVLMLGICFSFVQKEPAVSIKYFASSAGKWNGSITYLDYSSGKPFTMAANTTIVVDRKRNEVIMQMDYPNEPKANGNDTLSIEKNGSAINGSKIISNKKLKNGSIEIITEKNSVDGNDHKPAVLRHIYFIGKILFINRKEVKFAGTDKWIMRNEYRFTR